METTYTGYKDFGGIMFPSHIVQTQDGYPRFSFVRSRARELSHRTGRLRP